MAWRAFGGLELRVESPFEGDKGKQPIIGPRGPEESGLKGVKLCAPVIWCQFAPDMDMTGMHGDR